MSKKNICIVDYSVGNHASVLNSFRELNCRVMVSNDPAVMDAADILILPGVGAFPSAMKALHDLDLVSYLKEEAGKQRPIIGICLGMQLLTDASHEKQYTKGLGLIPGEIVPMLDPEWHIGWNTIECVQSDRLLQPSDSNLFYFNHSFVYDGSSEYQVCVSKHHNTFPSVIRSGSVLGIQFHPEKSQEAGNKLLTNLILGLGNA